MNYFAMNLVYGAKTTDRFEWSAWYTLYQLGVAFFIHDFILWAVHYTLHQVPWLYINVHKTHHEVKNPRISVSGDLTIADYYLVRAPIFGREGKTACLIDSDPKKPNRWTAFPQLSSPASCACPSPSTFCVGVESPLFSGVAVSTRPNLTPFFRPIHILFFGEPRSLRFFDPMGPGQLALAQLCRVPCELRFGCDWEWPTEPSDIFSPKPFPLQDFHHSATHASYQTWGWHWDYLVGGHKMFYDMKAKKAAGKLKKGE